MLVTIVDDMIPSLREPSERSASPGSGSSSFLEPNQVAIHCPSEPPRHPAACGQHGDRSSNHKRPHWCVAQLRAYFACQRLTCLDASIEDKSYAQFSAFQLSNRSLKTKTPQPLSPGHTGTSFTHFTSSFSLHTQPPATAESNAAPLTSARCASRNGDRRGADAQAPVQGL